jgi:hypothetical protein
MNRFESLFGKDVEAGLFVESEFSSFEIFGREGNSMPEVLIVFGLLFPSRPAGNTTPIQ